MVVNEQKEREVILCMGPLSVLPSYQNKGIGSMHLIESIKKAKQMNYKAVIIYGNPGYYYRFRFINAVHYAIQTSEGENFDAFMVLELFPGSLAGIKGRFFEDTEFKVDEKQLDFRHNAIVELRRQQIPVKDSDLELKKAHKK
jgi:predicted N-acetyltransferase YhbS